jgi:hypothetical protein
MLKSGYYQGEYIVENKEKYIGKSNPKYRSSWESRCCWFMDHNPNIIKWGYECVEIEYFNVIDKKIHKYYPDFYCETIDKEGLNKKYIIEVKPTNQTLQPKQPKINNKKAYRRYLYEAHQFVKNQCKWEAAKDFCKKRGLEFQIITEKEIFNK